MKFVDKIYNQTHEVKQSKFIAYLMPYHDYETKLQELKNQHSKARHFVVAYRYFNEFNQIVEYSSDDGEPKGTSGKPSLFVIQGADIINSAIIIVRYFGGTKLGTGGLVRAYSDAVNLVLDDAVLLEYTQTLEKTISFEYSNTRMIDYEASACGISIIEKIFDAQVIYKLKASLENMDKFLDKTQRIVK